MAPQTAWRHRNKSLAFKHRDPVEDYYYYNANKYPADEALYYPSTAYAYSDEYPTYVAQSAWPANAAPAVPSPPAPQAMTMSAAVAATAAAAYNTGGSSTAMSHHSSSSSISSNASGSSSNVNGAGGTVENDHHAHGYSQEDGMYQASGSSSQGHDNEPW